MEPSQRGRQPVDDLLHEDEERWERVAGAKTPEELREALDKPRRPGKGRAFRTAIFPLLVIGILVYTAIQTLVAAEDREPLEAPISADFDLPHISRNSVGPFAALPHGNTVAVVSAAGGDAVPVVPLGQAARHPVWRPDGRALLVSSLDGLVEIPVDRSGRPQWLLHRRLGASYRGVSPAYSPDGRRVAFVAVLADIVVGDLQGSRPRLVAELVEGYEPHELDWSRQGRLVVAAGGVIFVVQPDGAVVREVVSAIPTAAMPAWSPDGSRIAYTQLSPGAGEALMRVVVTEPASNTPPGEPIGPPGATTAYPAWSPEGRRLAYARFVGGTWDLYVYDLETRRHRRLTHGRGDEIDPAWSPDGRQIAFVGNMIPSPR